MPKRAYLAEHLAVWEFILSRSSPIRLMIIDVQTVRIDDQLIMCYVSGIQAANDLTALATARAAETTNS